MLSRQTARSAVADCELVLLGDGIFHLSAVSGAVFNLDTYAQSTDRFVPTMTGFGGFGGNSRTGGFEDDAFVRGKGLVAPAHSGSISGDDTTGTRRRCGQAGQFR